MNLTDEQAEIIANDIEPMVTDLVATYGQETAYRALFSYVSIKILRRIGPKAYSDCLLAGFDWLDRHTPKGKP